MLGMNPTSIHFTQLQKGIVLGLGGFATVFKGIYCGQDVAIKEFRSDIDAATLANINREFTMQFQLQNKNIVEILCFNIDPLVGFVLGHSNNMKWQHYVAKFNSPCVS
jgi:hypothetical protein